MIKMTKSLSPLVCLALGALLSLSACSGEVVPPDGSGSSGGGGGSAGRDAAIADVSVPEASWQGDGAPDAAVPEASSMDGTTADAGTDAPGSGDDAGEAAVPEASSVDSSTSDVATDAPGAPGRARTRPAATTQRPATTRTPATRRPRQTPPRPTQGRTASSWAATTRATRRLPTRPWMAHLPATPLRATRTPATRRSTRTSTLRPASTPERTARRMPGGDGGLTACPSICGADQKLCSEQCVSVDDPSYGCDPAACAPCLSPVFNQAAPPGAVTSVTCSAGSCAVGTCPAGWADCDGLFSNLCEADLTSAQDCGACGNACSASQLCIDGACVTTTACTFPDLDCSGTCRDSSSDPQACGGCGRACATSLYSEPLTCGVPQGATQPACGTTLTCAAGASQLTCGLFAGPDVNFCWKTDDPTGLCPCAPCLPGTICSQGACVAISPGGTHAMPLRVHGHDERRGQLRFLRSRVRRPDVRRGPVRRRFVDPVRHRAVGAGRARRRRDQPLRH